MSIKNIVVDESIGFDVKALLATAERVELAFPPVREIDDGGRSGLLCRVQPVEADVVALLARCGGTTILDHVSKSAHHPWYMYCLKASKALLPYCEKPARQRVSLRRLRLAAPCLLLRCPMLAYVPQC